MADKWVAALDHMAVATGGNWWQMVEYYVLWGNCAVIGAVANNGHKDTSGLITTRAVRTTPPSAASLASTCMSLVLAP